MKQEYQARRQALLNQCRANSIVVIFGASEVTRSRDTEYPFRQNSDFYYLTGFSEPDSVLVMVNSSKKNKNICSILFVRPKDKSAEVWHGRRLGVIDAPEALGVDLAYSTDDLAEVLIGLIDGHEHLYFSAGSNAHADAVVQTAMLACKNAPKQSKNAPTCIIDVEPMIHAMRLVKSDAEIEIMQRSANISAQAHIKAMQACKPGMFEYQLQATIEHHFAMNGAKHPAYNTIVGSGENACILHYTENADELLDGDLVLIDAGSEFQGYAADITRTFPVNGKFSKAQSDIYMIVLKAQKACIDACKPGVTIAELMQIAIRITIEGLLALGVLQGELEALIKQEAHKPFFMHGLGHYLGLDVHDVGNYKENGKDKPLEAGVVITIEPGIYINDEADVPSQYMNIGVRIEDNVVLTKDGNHVLTHGVVKEINDIETLMAG